MWTMTSHITRNLMTRTLRLLHARELLWFYAVEKQITFSVFNCTINIAVASCACAEAAASSGIAFQ